MIADPYGSVHSVEVLKCATQQQIIINFKAVPGRDEIEGDSVVVVSLHENQPLVKFDVDLFKLPQNKQESQEVTVNFYSNIKNKGIFYTDSNGLEMQRRELDKREYFDPKWEPAYLNVPLNFYPITSAILIQDQETEMQMTVMNDRTQGGSVQRDGHIELMMQRRSNHDDQLGIDRLINMDS